MSASVGLKCRIAALPLCHAFFILILFATGGPSLAIDIVALSDKFRNCPVLNTRFVPFWFHSGFSILQLSLALFISIILIVLACKRSVNEESQESHFIKKYLVGAVGASGDFITIHPEGHPQINRDFEDKRIDLILLNQYGNDEMETNCCGRVCSKNYNRSNNCNQYGWLHPISVLIVIIFIGHMASLIWFSHLRLTVSKPTENFPSFLTDLFIEAKVFYWTHMKSNNYVQPMLLEEKPLLSLNPNSLFCWTLIQRTFHCCGAREYMDWLQNDTYSKSPSDYVQYLPHTCFCPQEHVGANKCYNQPVLETVSGLVYTQGCLNPLTERLYHLFTIEIIVISCLVILLPVGFFTDLFYTLCTAQKVLEMRQGKNVSEQTDTTNSRQFWQNSALYKR